MLIIKKVGKIDFKQYLQYIKGQCYDTLTPIFFLKTLYLPLVNSLKKFRKPFRFREDIQLQNSKMYVIAWLATTQTREFR